MPAAAARGVADVEVVEGEEEEEGEEGGGKISKVRE